MQHRVFHRRNASSLVISPQRRWFASKAAVWNYVTLEYWWQWHHRCRVHRIKAPMFHAMRPDGLYHGSAW